MAKSKKKDNKLAAEVVNVVLKQLQQSWIFKQPRIKRIRDYRRLYNSQTLPKLRSQFNVPLPIFAGMIDTLQADLDDKLIIEYHEQDPADWKACQKANSALHQVSEGSSPETQWDQKHVEYRFEKIITGRATYAFSAHQDKDGKFETDLEVVPFEDFFFEPMGGPYLERHLFAGRQNVQRTRWELEEGAKNGYYDADQVRQLVENGGGGSEWKRTNVWDGLNYDVANHFRPLGLNPEGYNYVGEEVYSLVEWVLEFKGIRWYMLLEPYTGTWVKFCKNSELRSSDRYPFISSASHKDSKNFASKSFADDLYPVADSIITLFNQDLTNRSKRNLNAKAYDRQMFKDVQKLDEAQYRPDALVPVDTMNGTRKIKDGIFAFETPAISGTIDLIDWLSTDTGKNLGVTDMQQGASQPVSKKVGVMYAEMAQISKRLAFKSKPFLEMGKQLGNLFFTALQDFMKYPMSVEMLGEKGVEWDLLTRRDLLLNKDFKISVTSQMERNNENDFKSSKRQKALELTAQSQNINPKVRDEMILRDAGFAEHDIALLMDTNADTDKETIAEAAMSIQEIILRNKKPKINWNADRFFVKRILDFAKKHRDTLSDSKFKMLVEYADAHIEIAEENVAEEAKMFVQKEMQMQNPNINPNQVIA